ncbi:hypothetical protein SDC9_153978 [bioreactor metagenome]|uniref:Uncharacterized protein n=1 Tax=bioreactor metagenome TaxID=1076179 RepID=A0A645EZP8_9ZZZZ
MCILRAELLKVPPSLPRGFLKFGLVRGIQSARNDRFLADCKRNCRGYRPEENQRKKNQREFPRPRESDDSNAKDRLPDRRLHEAHIASKRCSRLRLRIGGGHPLQKILSCHPNSHQRQENCADRQPRLIGQKRDIQHPFQQGGLQRVNHRHIPFGASVSLKHG